jgi:Ca-activated chloride channel family protein
VPSLSLVASNDPAEVERGRDGAILASAASVIASRRQLEANNAYAQGDVARATRLTAENEATLSAAMAAAPAPAASALSAQRDAYSVQKRGFSSFRPGSAEGKSHAKAATAHDFKNLDRADAWGSSK